MSVDLEKLVRFLLVLKYRELGECVSTVSAGVRVQQSEWTHRDPQTAEKHQHSHPILSEAGELELPKFTRAATTNIAKMIILLPKFCVYNDRW